jgi:hypothetical protein
LYAFLISPIYPIRVVHLTLLHLITQFYLTKSKDYKMTCYVFVSVLLSLPQTVLHIYIYIYIYIFIYQSRDSSVSIALGYGLDDRGSRVRFPAGAGNFSLHHRVQSGSGAHPASYPMGTGDSFSGGKAAGEWSWPLTSI